MCFVRATRLGGTPPADLGQGGTQYFERLRRHKIRGTCTLRLFGILCLDCKSFVNTAGGVYATEPGDEIMHQGTCRNVQEKDATKMQPQYSKKYVCV